MCSELEYENQAFVEQLSNDGLTIMARGLGVEKVFLRFMRLYCDPQNLVLVVNTTNAEEGYFLEELHSGEQVQQLPTLITNEVNVKQREQLYLHGGVVFVSKRILVVDILSKRCPVDKVSGLLVYNAHRVVESSTVAFILRLYRQANKEGFIKAFTDTPELFSNGFCKFEHVMKSLYLKNAYLWPRFHATVGTSLSKHTADVVELRQQMTPNMTAIQIAVMDIMNVCLNELKSSVPSIDADVLTLDIALHKSFDHIIRMQLEPVWNQLSSKLRQLLVDLRKLKSLLYCLIQHDAVTFYYNLQTLSISNCNYQSPSSQSAWMFLDAANTLLVKAYERVYGKKTESLRNIKDVHLEGATPEENPKWHLLSVVLNEINTANKCGNTLIVVNDQKTCYQLKEYLCKGGSFLLQKQYERFFGSNNASLAKRRKLDSGGSKPTLKSETKATECFQEENEISEMDVVDLTFNSDGKVTDCTKFSSLLYPVIAIHCVNARSSAYYMSQVLTQLKPQFIIIYDADFQFVRQVEAFTALNPGITLRVYFLFYECSVEEQKYLTELRREKESFQQLIKDRAQMAISVDKDISDKDESLFSKISQKVIVDVREFRSALPSFLHRRNFDIVPVTLEVGDYILTPDVCIERKSVSDLFGSLNSGRLYNQVTAMNRHYKRPMLLIELSQEKTFSLQGISANRDSSQIGSEKLVLLTLHFPCLRILWCHSSQAATDLFKEIKLEQLEPNSESIMDLRESCEVDSSFLASAKDFILKVPGVNTRNYRLLMEKCKDFQEVITYDTHDLIQNLRVVNGTLIWNFLHYELLV